MEAHIILVFDERDMLASLYKRLRSVGGMVSLVGGKSVDTFFQIHGP